MNFLIFVLLTIGINSNRIYYKVTATTETLKVIRKSLGVTTVNSDKVEKIPEKEISWKDLYSKENSGKLQDFEKDANTKMDSSNRKSKILKSLAFLAGLSVGGLAGASSTDVKTYSKFPPLSVNVGASQISPHVAAIYDPYPYVMYPYLFAPPLPFYSFWDLLRLQAINRLQNNFQPLTQNLQALNLLDNNKPSDLLNNDEYVQEAQKIENVKTSNIAEDTDKDIELQVKDDRNAEEKMTSSGAACSIQKETNAKQGSPVKSIFRDRENVDGSLTTLDLRAINTTGQMTVTNATADKTNTSMTTDTMQNSTMNGNHTEPPFYGYYGGYPQNVNHIDLTTETYEHKYHDYEPINYNLPSYDKPINFYSDERYNYYSPPLINSYPTSQFRQEQIPEYLSNDFKRFLYTSDHTPLFANSDFRPVV